MLYHVSNLIKGGSARALTLVSRNHLVLLCFVYQFTPLISYINDIVQIVSAIANEDSKGSAEPANRRHLPGLPAK